MRVVHSHRRVLRCDRSLSSESAITVLWIWFGMAIPWYRFLNERVTFSIAFVSRCVCGTVPVTADRASDPGRASDAPHTGMIIQVQLEVK
mgnify:CR=1 FL=1